MYYELYVDVLFLVNFMMDYLLLLLVRRMLRCTATHGSICAGALTGSLMTCIIFVSPVPYAFLKFMMFHMLVNTLMIRVGLKIKTVSNFMKAFFMLYTGGFLLGGVLSYLQQYINIRMGSLFFVTAAAGYWIVTAIWNFISHIQRINRHHCKVELYMGEREYRVIGIIDTGNGLWDAAAGKPVSILDKRTAGDFFDMKKIEKIRYVPYRSIGKSAGVLPVVEIDKMCVYGSEVYWIQKPLIAISEEEILAGGECKMILNPDLF